MQIPFAPVLIVALAAAIVAADRRLKVAAQPLRLRLAEKGEEFLQLRNVPEQARGHVKFLLDHAFNMRSFLLLSLVSIPIIAVIFVVRPKSILRSADQLNYMDACTLATFVKICRLHNRITLVNHWILLPLVEIEIGLLMPLAIILRAVIYGSVPETGGRESVITFIEDRQIRLRLKHSHIVANSR
jgi:hypothetical protein